MGDSSIEVRSRLAARYVKRGDAYSNEVNGSGQVVCADRESGMVSVQYDKGLFAGHYRQESALSPCFLEVIAERIQAESALKKAKGIPADWEFADRFSDRDYEWLARRGEPVCQKTMGGHGTPYVAYEMTVLDTRDGLFLPLHGDVALPAVNSVGEATAALQRYFDELPDRNKLAVTLPAFQP